MPSTSGQRERQLSLHMSCGKPQPGERVANHGALVQLGVEGCHTADSSACLLTL